MIPALTKLKLWQNACITPSKRKQCLQNAGETILHLNKLWQNASKFKVQFLLHNEQQTPANAGKRKQNAGKRKQNAGKCKQNAGNIFP